jgi:guanylate kinase
MPIIKGTFHERMRREYPDVFEFSVSYTTRKPRPGEVHGVNYFYVTKEEFEKVGRL